ncbi:MAG: response regulator [Chloroflexi bacterium]|nr:response regulator [Chloroflexota bacterium]
MSDILKGRAVKVLPSVVILALEDGRTGVLPRREFMIETRRDLRQVVSLDQEFSVIVENEIAGEEPRFWVRHAHSDQWARVPLEFAPGGVVTGIVRGVEPFGIFVDLLPGITGLIPREEVSDQPINSTEEFIWVGDVVKCQVLFVNTGQQRITLSSRAAAAARSQDLQTGSPNGAAVTAARAPEAQLHARLTGAIPPLKIFLVDNEIALRDQLAEHLRQAGHAVEVAASAQSAAARLQKESFDLIVLDINLGDGSGLDLARRLIELDAHPRIVLMTDWIRASELDQELAPLFNQGVDLISKPNHVQELDELLADYSDSSASQRRTKRARRKAQTPSRANLDHALTVVLNKLQDQTHAGQIAVFTVDPLTQKLLIQSYHGAEKLNEAELLGHWRYSPVRDVLQDGETVHTPNAQDERNAARFRYLLSALDFKSCVGVPVPAETPTALFLFHKEANRFSRIHFQYVRAASERIAAALDRHVMEKALVETQRFILLGQLGAVVVHEINNKLGSLNWDARMLPDDLLKLEQQTIDSSRLQNTRQLLSKSLERSRVLRGATAELVKLTTDFDSLIRHQDPARLNVHDLVNQTLAISAPYAEDANVTCRKQFEHSAPFVNGIAIRLQQALLNVVLNAIQQIHERGVRKGGHILVTTRAPQDAARRHIEIRIHDDGPGIHTAQLGRVFDLGFTTRDKGSGIGLFMTRWLVESLGGMVKVEQSHVLWGTTMLIQLPLAESGGGSNG